MYYLLALLADVGIAGSFSLSKVYRDRVPYSIKSISEKIMVTTLLSAVILFAMQGFTLEINGYTLFMAVIMNIIGICSEVVCFTAYGKGKISLFTVFQMQGGMLLPFLYGVIFGDKITIPRMIGIVIMTISLILTVAPNNKGKKQEVTKSFVLLCCAIFFINGLVSIGSYLYSNNEMTLGPANFLIIKALMLGSFAAVIWTANVFRKKEKPIQLKERIIRSTVLLGSTVVDNGTYFLQLVSAAHLPSTVLYPVVTGGTVIFTAVAGRIFFKEKHTLKEILGFALSFLAILLFAF